MSYYKAFASLGKMGHVDGMSWTEIKHERKEQRCQMSRKVSLILNHEHHYSLTGKVTFAVNACQESVKTTFLALS